MTVIDRVGGDLPRGRVTVELDDIQATVLRYRPSRTTARTSCSMWTMRVPAARSCAI